jgi:HEAT repeat protein
MLVGVLLSTSHRGTAQATTAQAVAPQGNAAEDLPLAAWAKDLRSEHKDYRTGVLYRISRLGPKARAAAAIVVERLKTDPDPSVRVAAAYALSTMGPKVATAAPALVEVLRNDSEPEVRGMAAWALADVAADVEVAAAALIKALDDRATYDGLSDGPGEHFPPSVRRHAAEALGHLRAPEAVVPLTRVLGDCDPDTGAAVADALAQIGPDAKAAVRALAKAIEHDNDRFRFAAIRALGGIGPGAEAAVPALTRKLKSGKPYDRILAAGALGSIGPAAETAIPVLLAGRKEPGLGLHYDNALGNIGRPLLPHLIRDLESGQPEAQLRAAQLTSHMGPEVAVTAPALAEALRECDANTRVHLVAALNRLGPAARPAVDPLRRVLRDEDKWVRYLAASALVGIDPDYGETVLPVLVELLRDEEMQRHAMDVVTIIGPRAKDAVPELVAALKAESKYVRLKAAATLWLVRQRSDDAIAVLRQGMADENYEIRAAAAFRAGRIGPRARKMIPDLSALLRDPKSSVRLRAAEALGKMGPAAKAVVPQLIPLLDDSYVETRHFTAVALGRIGPSASVAVPALEEAGCTQDWTLRRLVADALAKITFHGNVEP